MRFLPVSILAIAGLLVSLTAGSAPLVLTPSWSLKDAEETAGHQLFVDHCAACHGRQADARIILAPTLQGIVGRTAGTVPGFPYSDALKKSGIVWTQDNLHKWLADNAHFVPGTLMPHVSVSDPAEQIYLIAYLKTLKAPASH